MPSTEEIIIMRNQREIMEVLKSVEGKLQAAMAAGDEKETATALKKAEIAGKHARLTQSLARASDVNANSKRKVKADGPPIGMGTICV
jgi:hypothetical protein